MKHWLRLALCGGALAALLTCGASAAEMDYTTNVNGTVTYDSVSGKYTASYNQTIDGQQYALLVVKGTYENGAADYSISEDTIMYIDQMAAGSTGVSFNFIPRSTPDCVVLLGGKFSDGQSPKVLGTLIGKGVTVSGTVRCGNTTLEGATVSLYKNDGTVVGTGISDNYGKYAISSVPLGENYYIEISKSGFVSSPIAIDMTQSETDVVADDIIAFGGDINSNGSINVDDLGFLLRDYGLGEDRTYPLSDITGNGYVNVDDLGYLLNGYGKNNASGLNNGGET